MQRTFIYVDGFNLYYRGVKNTPHKWLDLKKLCRMVLDDTHEICGIKYFTALVSGKIDPRKPIKQQSYIRALQKTIPELSVHYGHFLTNPAWAVLADSQQQKVKIIKTEEKGSDVNLAVHVVNDAWLDKYDCAIILSNDSDLAEAVNLVKKHHNKKVGLMLPPSCIPSKTLMRASDFVKKIRYNVLEASQMPSKIAGTNIRKPADW